MRWVGGVWRNGCRRSGSVVVTDQRHPHRRSLWSVSLATFVRRGLGRLLPVLGVVLLASGCAAGSGTDAAEMAEATASSLDEAAVSDNGTAPVDGSNGSAAVETSTGSIGAASSGGGVDGSLDVADGSPAVGVGSDESDPATSDDHAGPPPPTGPIVYFAATETLAISLDGSFVYAATSSAWDDPADCDAPPVERLALRSIDAGVESASFGAGLVESANVHMMSIGENNQALFILRCDGDDGPQSWLRHAQLGPSGEVAWLSRRLLVENAERPFFAGWRDAKTVIVGRFLRIDPNDDFEAIHEYRLVSLESGEILDVQVASTADGAPLRTTHRVTFDDWTYRVVADERGRPGCEGTGIAATLAVDDGSGERPAFEQPEVAFSSLADLQVSSTGYISWVSRCDGYTTPWVGRISSDGSIVDAHRVDLAATGVDETGGVTRSGAYLDVFRVTDDGYLLGAGRQHSQDFDASRPALVRYDLSSDPFFVTGSDVQIENAPLFDALAPNGTWHLGDTLAARPACGATTLYGAVDGVFNRALPAGLELDTIVDADVSDATRISFDDGYSFAFRTVVLQTECPSEYDGRRLWYGTESDTVFRGMSLRRVEVGEVADVLSITIVPSPSGGGPEFAVATVELLDGTVRDVELRPF